MSDKTHLTTGTIFDEKGYDEMQKRENHEIGFRLFRIMFFIVLLVAFILVMVCGKAGNMAGMIVSLGLLAITYGFYIVYAYMTAKRGIMNPKFAKSWSSKWVIPVYIALILLWSYKIFHSLTGECNISDIALYSIWIIILTGSILMSLCAGINNRVLCKQLEESE